MNSSTVTKGQFDLLDYILSITLTATLPCIKSKPPLSSIYTHKSILATRQELAIE